MNLRHLDAAKELIPDFLQMSTWIAGGAVIAEDPRDVDIWVVVPGDEARVAATSQILQHLAAQSLDVDVFDPARYAWKGNTIAKVGTVMLFDRPYQIMVWIGEHVSDLLDSFDLSIHAHGVNLSTGYKVSGPRATRLEDREIRVQTFDRSRSTLRRYVRLCDRYGVIPNRDDVKRLADAVMQDAREKAEAEVKMRLQDLGVAW